MTAPNSGLPELGILECASRPSPTCVPLSNFRQAFENAKIRERNQGSPFATLGIRAFSDAKAAQRSTFGENALEHFPITWNSCDRLEIAPNQSVGACSFRKSLSTFP